MLLDNLAFQGVNGYGAYASSRFQATGISRIHQGAWGDGTRMK